MDDKLCVCSLRGQNRFQALLIDLRDSCIFFSFGYRSWLSPNYLLQGKEISLSPLCYPLKARDISVSLSGRCCLSRET